jgi:hypothetical protein
MNNTQIVYKVVCVEENNLVSAIIYNKAKIIYPIGKWVKPKIKGSLILTFDSFAHAFFFFSRSSYCLNKKFEIWKCEGNVKEEGIYLLSISAQYKNMVSFWRSTGYWNYPINTPIGTLCCSKIKLLEKIEF